MIERLKYPIYKMNEYQKPQLISHLLKTQYGYLER